MPLSKIGIFANIHGRDNIDILQRGSVSRMGEEFKSESTESSISRLQGQVDQIGKKDKITLIISSLAFIVSTISLMINIITNDRDSTYRELALTPKLQTMFDLGDLSFGFQNKGPGAAEIRRFVMWDQTKCVDSDNSNDWTNSQLYYLSGIPSEYLNALSAIVPDGVKYQDQIVIHPQRGILDYQTLLKDGAVNVFLKLDVTMQKSDEAILRDFHFDFAKAKRKTFYNLMKEKHFSIDYCSISGRTCKHMEFMNNGSAVEKKVCDAKQNSG